METTDTVSSANTTSSNKRYLVWGAVGGVMLTLILILIVALVVREPAAPEDQSADVPDPTATMEAKPTLAEVSFVSWQFDEGAKVWRSSSPAPSCPEPLTFSSPVDPTLPTSILYPGQYRGGNYKAHGGFRFDNKSDQLVDINLPMAAYLTGGSRYIESGTVQYLLDFLAPCGIMFRFDHLATLTPELQAIVDAEFPEAKVDDSRTTNIPQPKFFAAETLIATEVGFAQPLNVGVDFGVYDLRQPNNISINNIWSAEHANFAAQTYFGICWLDYLEPDAKTIIKQLRQIGSEGNVSDYCEID